MKKALYRLKQMPRAWYRRIDNYMIKNGFFRRNTEPTLYIKVNEHGHILIGCLYVDDMLFISDFALDEFKVAMMKEFEMTDLS
ncbi:reverse transcriptase domain-containing protein, partial [Actinobacillus pleuropneumoniae]